MKAKSVKLVVAAALVVVLAGAVAISQTLKPARYGRGMHGGHMLGFFARQLDLTDAQRSQMKQIMAQEKPTVKPLMQQLAQGRRQLVQLELSANFDENAVRNLASQQAQTMTDLTVERARIANQMFNVLTPDQKTKLNQLMAERQQRFQQRMQEHQQPANPPSQ
jgi:periplasmic protein CpxP/Spy